MTEEEHVPAYVRQHGPLQTPVRVVQLANELATLRLEPVWQRGERVARTIAKEGKLRLVLTLMPAGTRLHEHRAEGALTLQCLAGRLRLEIEATHPLELIEGELVALDGGVTHTAEAVTECAFLLTIAQ